MPEPIRTCIGCRTREPASALIRLVADGDGEVQVDVRHRLPGRGAWIHPTTECIAKAARRRALPRALRREGLAMDTERLAAAARLETPGEEGLD